MLTRNPQSKKETRALTFSIREVVGVHFQKLFTIIFYFLQKPEDKDLPLGPTKNVMWPECPPDAGLPPPILNNKGEHVPPQLFAGMWQASGEVRARWESRGASVLQKRALMPIYCEFIWLLLIIKSQIKGKDGNKE